ncbi:winged helix-turn-helix transcriptional regulator [Paenibacillus graminis]|uniref:winged helix-turn-helix transcriptional regulator n=1 Tax=Paenibacillus graminis TaxID=189425 RepID=UPI002DBEB59D|nr:winged helix-turn-helix transcriptional regulator [Paenibacillus graminis]MEC0167093.1 winged helix-turn-helix transcriptional regulator [Paenibacillus graminis]
MKYDFNFDQLCPATYAFSVIGGIWNYLKYLMDYSIVHREQFNEVPPRVEYSLTEKNIPLNYSISCRNGTALLKDGTVSACRFPKFNSVCSQQISYGFDRQAFDHY